jgi:hypothetical protein
MNRTADNKRPIEQILVVKSGAVSAVQSGGEALTDSTTGLVDLAEGEIRILSSKGYGTVASNIAIAPAAGVTAAPEIFIVRGNENASNPFAQEKYPLTTRPYEQTESIDGNNKMIYTYKAAARPTFDTWVVGNTVGQTNAINVADETEYALRVAFFGRDMDEAYGGAHKPPAYTASYVSKDYTTLGHTAAEATDDIIQNLVYDINLNSSVLKFNKANTGSRKPLIAFAVDSTGANGVSIKTLKPGTFVPAVNTNTGLKGIVVSWDIIKSFENASSSLPSTATVVPVDLTLAGDAAVAGTALTSPNSGNYSNGYQGILTMATNPTANDTVTVGTGVYTFVASPAVAGDVDLGVDAATSRANLVAAINLGPGSGTAYHASTVANPEGARARLGAGNTVVITAATAVTTTETFTAVGNVFGAATAAAVNVVSGKADQLVLMTLDRNLAYEDRIPYVKTRIEVGLFDGFNSDTVLSTKVQESSEGSGTARQWQIIYDNTHRQRQYDQYRGFEAMKIQYPNPVEEDVFYDAAILEHYHFDTVGTTNVVKPFKAIILIPNAENANTGALTADVNGKAVLTTVLAPWVATTVSPIVSVLG